MYQITSRFSALFDKLIEPVLPADSLRRKLRQHVKSRARVLREKYSQESPGSPNVNNGINSNGLANRYRTRKRSFPFTNTYIHTSRSTRSETEERNTSQTSDSDALLETQRSIQQHLRSIDDSLKEIVRLKELKYANLGLL